MKKITFKKSKWIQSQMGTLTGDHCALGFYLEQIGISNEEIRMVSSPASLVARAERDSPEKQKLLLQRFIDAGAEWLVCPTKDANYPGFTDSGDADAVMNANDRGLQFHKIKEIFAKHGIEVELVP